jgi:DNA polymerase III delta prime subunit
MNPREFDAFSAFDAECLLFPPFVAAFEAIERLLQQYRHTGMVENLLVTGESGTGKTTLCRLLLQKHPKQIHRERDVIPVLFVSMPPAATIGGAAEQMLLRLGDPAPTKGTTSSKTARAIQIARGCGVELLLFDEANHIQDRGSSPTQYYVGDWLKSLTDELQKPCVLLGLPRVEALLRVNEQLRRRFTRQIHMELGQDPDIAIESECIQLFNSLAHALPIPFDPGHMAWDELGHRVRFGTDGRVAFFKVLLAQALRTGMEKGLDVLTVADLEAAFSAAIWPQGIGALNPFNSLFAFRRLDRAGEPFERGALGAGRR